MKYTAAALTVLLLLTPACLAEIKQEVVQYVQGDVTMKSEVFLDDARTDKRPGVLVVPEWWGLNDYARTRARQLAELGYVAMAVDVYGDGFSTIDPAEAGKRAGAFMEDRALLRQRINAALDQLKQQASVDAARTAAIGYCFGGTAVLELARSGADIAGVVSFHGNLGTPAPQDAANIKTRVLVLHGAADPFIKPEEFDAFVAAMEEADIDHQINVYGNALHGFTNPDSDKLQMQGVGYNKQADRRSWKAMKAFFGEIFAKKI